MSQLRAMQTEAVDRGTLQINVTSSVNAFPVERAEISISYTGVPESTLEKIQTDSSGQTETIELAAPPEEWSLDIEEDRQPYSEYTLSIKAPGFEPVNIAGTEISCKCKGNTEHTDETSRCERGRGSSIRYPRSYFIWRLSPEDRRGRDQAGDRDGGDCFKPCGCAGVYCGT